MVHFGNSFICFFIAQKHPCLSIVLISNRFISSLPSVEEGKQHIHLVVVYNQVSVRCLLDCELHHPSFFSFHQFFILFIMYTFLTAIVSLTLILIRVIRCQYYIPPGTSSTAEQEELESHHCNSNHDHDSAHHILLMIDLQSLFRGVYKRCRIFERQSFDGN